MDANRHCSCHHQQCPCLTLELGFEITCCYKALLYPHRTYYIGSFGEVLRDPAWEVISPLGLFPDNELILHQSCLAITEDQLPAHNLSLYRGYISQWNQTVVFSIQARA